MSKTLALSWTNHLKGDAKKDFEGLVRNSTTVLGRLKTIIEQREADILKDESSPKDYDSPSWAYKQAHNNGRKEELRRLKELLSFF